MKLKTIEHDGETYAVVQDGKPVYIEDDGKEVAFDAAGTRATIARLNSEAKKHREAKEAAEADLAKFEGIEDPEKAIDAIEKLKNIDAKKLIDAGEVEKVKEEVAKAYEEKIKAAHKQYEPVIQERDKLKDELYAEKIGGSFSRSKFANEKLAIPADMVQARFGQNFKVEDGKIVAYDQTGNQIYSKASPGELAGFDEALEILVDNYPYRDNILKGSGGSGSGKQPGGGVPGGNKQILRSEWDRMDHGERSSKVRDGYKVVDG